LQSGQPAHALTLNEYLRHLADATEPPLTLGMCHGLSVHFLIPDAFVIQQPFGGGAVGAVAFGINNDSHLLIHSIIQNTTPMNKQLTDNNLASDS